MGEKFDFGEHRVAEDGTVTHLAGWDSKTSREEALAYCTLVTKSHYENFVVTNHFTPEEHVQPVSYTHLTLPTTPYV